MSSFECRNSVYEITDEKKSFSITIPGHGQTKSDEKTTDVLNKVLEIRSLELHVKEVRKGVIKKLGDNEYKLSDFDAQKNEILQELKNVKHHDIQDLVYRFQLTYDEIIDILDLKIFLQKERVIPYIPAFMKWLIQTTLWNIFSPMM